MRRFLLLTTLFLSVHSTLFAQNIPVTFHGRILDSATHNPLEGVSVVWFSSKEEKIATATSGSDGHFELKTTKPAAGTLSIQITGYTPLRMALPAGSNAGDIYLTTTYTSLKEVTITTRKKQTYLIEPDKKVFNVESNLAAKGGTIAEVFNQVPGITINAAGKLTLRNSTPVLLIDGKATNLTLDQIPADQVATIEIITNPSAKYDASGNSGIVNIITKRNRKPGFNGTLNANWSTIPEYNVYGDINLSKGQFRLNMNYLQHGHQGQYKETTAREDYTTNTTLYQTGHSVTKGPFRKGKFTLDWLPGKKDVFTLYGDIGSGDFKTTHDQTTVYAGKNTGTDSTGYRTIRIRENFSFAHAGLDYARQFTKPNEQLTGSFSFETYKGPNAGTYNMQYYDKLNNTSGSPQLQQYNGGIKAHTLVLRSDYTDPLRNGHARLETGFKITWHADHNQNLMQDFDATSGKYLTNPYATYNFRYNDPAYAAYGNYSDKYGRFSYMAGLRFEQYNYTGRMIDSNVTIAYRNPGLYPSLFLTQGVGKSGELHVNYSRRVTRPAFDEISPFTDYSNPQSLTKGNPYLQSEHTNLVELSYNNQFGKINLQATAYLRNTNNAITSYTTSIAPDTLLTSYINARYNNTYGAELVAKMPFTSWWDMIVNGNLFDTHIATSGQSGGLSNSGLSWFGKLSSHARLPKSITLELSGSYEAPKVVSQGKTLSTGAVNIAVGKSLLKKKNATVTMSLTDLFNTNREGTRIISASQFSQTNTQKYLTRVFKINFNYQFGSKDKNAVKHNTEGASGEAR